MELEKRKLSGREKDEAAVKLLEQLREKLHFAGNISTARRIAHNLSWMQEDGLDILKEAVFGDFSKRTKFAAAYGLRSMHGRMRKMALDVLEEGVKHRNEGVREICNHALSVASGGAQGKALSRGPARATRARKFRIRDISANSSRRRRTSSLYNR